MGASDADPSRIPIEVAEAGAWVRSRLPTAGPLELFQVEPWATVYRVPVDGDVAWFKACAPHQAFEVPLTASLSSRWPTVTEVLAHDPDHRWLLMADAGQPFRVFGNPPERWLEILPAYAVRPRGSGAFSGAGSRAGSSRAAAPSTGPARSPSV